MEASQKPTTSMSIHASALPLLGTYAEDACYRHTHAPMSIDALFTIARKWIWSTCPPKDKWIMKMDTYRQ